MRCLGVRASGWSSSPSSTRFGASITGARGRAAAAILGEATNKAVRIYDYTYEACVLYSLLYDVCVCVCIVYLARVCVSISFQLSENRALASRSACSVSGGGLIVAISWFSLHFALWVRVVEGEKKEKGRPVRWLAGLISGDDDNAFEFRG